MAKLHAWLIFCVFLRLGYCENVSPTAQETLVYSYTSTLSFPGHASLDRVMKGYVFVKSRTLPARRKQNGSKRGGNHRILMEFVVDLIGTERPLEGLVSRDESGMIENILLPTDANSSDMRVNFLKAAAGIFNYHHAFEAGLEYDTSGGCRTFYAEVDASAEEGDKDYFKKAMVIDKQKLMCEPINQPMDAGLWSFSPIFRENRVTQSWVRYHFKKNSRLITRARTFEQHKVSFALDDDAPGSGTMVAEGEQQMSLLEDDSAEKKRVVSKISAIIKPRTSSQVSSIAVEIFGENYHSQHLALSIPQLPVSSGCGIQTAAFDEESLDSPGISLTQRILAHRLQAFESALDKPALISSVHASLQLLRFIRCLPSNQLAIQGIATALDFIPASPRDVHRQLQTGWHSQLTDVLVNCGTDLCTELLRQRLVRVAQLAAFDKLGAAAPREVGAVRAYLLDNLWPALAHLSNPSVSVFQEFVALCHHSLPEMETLFRVDELESGNPYTCLLTVSSLSSRFQGKHGLEKMLIGKVTELLREYLRPEDAFEDDKFNRQRLLAVFAGIERVRNPRLAIPLLSVIKISQIPSVIRSVGLKTLSRLDYDKDAIAIAEVTSQLMDLLYSPKSVSHEDDELIIKFGAFSVLLSMETQADLLADVLASFGRNKQWSLLSSCRRLVQTWCREELLSEASCNCIQRGGPLRKDSGDFVNPFRMCQPGLAAGWSGLAGTTTAGEVNLISGDLVDLRPLFLSDYSLKWVTGPDGEFRSSNLDINIIGPESEAKLMNFHIYGDKLAALMGKGNSGSSPWLATGFSLLRGSVPPRQIFSGGLTELMSMLFFAPSQPTPIFNSLRLPVDVRRYISVSSGWVLRNDIQGATSIELSGALEQSFLSQSVKSLIRTRAAFALENVLQLATSDVKTTTVSSLVNGVASAARLDFVTRVEIAGIPESICMSFQRSRASPVMRWSGESIDPVELGKRVNILQPLPTPDETRNNFFELLQFKRLPPMSYHLGALNAARCRTMGGTNDW